MSGTEEERFGNRRFRDLLARERSDMAWLVHCVAAMYDEISGGRITIPMTYPSEVVGQFGERLQEAVDDAVAEARREWEAEGIDADVLGMALDLVDEEDSRVGVVGRGRKVDRVVAEYARLAAARAVLDAKGTEPR